MSAQPVTVTVEVEMCIRDSIKVGQEVTCILPKADRPYTAAVITLSDKGAAGEREDKSGPAIVEMLKSAGYDIKETLLLADEPVSYTHLVGIKACIADGT